MSGWFDIEDRGFIRQQAGRDPEEIVRELVQNAMDAPNARNIHVEVTWLGSGEAQVIVEDDGAGFDDLSQVYTVFLSGKHDDPTKRGRKGRGLKEAIAACHSATVEIKGKTVLFTTEGRTRSRKTRSSTRTSGTRVELNIRRWKKADVDRIMDRLDTFDPPPGARLFVNKVQVEDHTVIETVPVRLQTVLIEEDTEVRRTRDTQVRLLEPKDDETPHIYEMGIPVCEVDTPWHLDVQQRIPLPDHRSTVPQSWLERLKVQVLDEMGARLNRTQLQETWATSVLDRAKPDVQQHYVTKVFGDNIAIQTTADKDANTMAEEDLGRTVIDSRHLPAAVRTVLRSHAPSTREVVRQAVAANAARPVRYKALTETADEKALCRFVVWLAKKALGKVIHASIDWEVRIFDRQVAASWRQHGGLGLDALFAGGPADSEGVITFSRKKLEPSWFKQPLGPSQLSLVIHELAHAWDNGEYGHTPRYYQALEMVSGKVAAVLAAKADEARKVIG